MAQDTSKSDGLEGFITRVEANGHIRAALDALNALHRDARAAYCFVEWVRIGFHESGSISADDANDFARYVEILAKHVREATDNLAEVHRLMIPEDYVPPKEPYVRPSIREIFTTVSARTKRNQCPACLAGLVTHDEGLTVQCANACGWHAPAPRKKCEVCKQRNGAFTWGAAWKLGPFWVCTSCDALSDDEKAKLLGVSLHRGF